MEFSMLLEKTEVDDKEDLNQILKNIALAKGLEILPKLEPEYYTTSHPSTIALYGSQLNHTDLEQSLEEPYKTWRDVA